MIPIKIQCGCGQRYAFEVEPVAGHMPAAVACPVCGGDGTAAANAILAEAVPAQVALAPMPAANGPLHAPASTVSIRRAVSTASAPSRGAELRGPQMDHAQAEHEARAKISWGDAPEEVVKYLMIQGLNYQEASAMVQGMFKERAKAIRGNGFKKIFIGIGLMCVPIVALIVFLSMGILPLKLFAGTIIIGLWGAWMVLKGIIMVVAPKSEPGDVAEQ